MKNIWFIIGPPGSKWSSFYNILSLTVSNVNNSDKSLSRYYSHGENITHEGAYFGPGMGLGENWHLKESVTRENILSEIKKVWEDDDQIKLVKSHVLALHLPELRKAFPESKFIFVTRPYTRLVQGWLGAGGFEKITYPDYKTYYKDTDTFKTLVEIEARCINRYTLDLPVRMYSKKLVKEYFNVPDDALNTLMINELDKHLLSYDDVSITVEN